MDQKDLFNEITFCFAQVKDILFPVIDDARWLSNLEATGWLNHVKMVLAGAVNIADKVSSFHGPVSYFNNSIRSRTKRPL